MIINQTYFKGDIYTPDLWCDKSFPFDDVLDKCLRNIVGNCLYNEIKSAYDADCVLLDTAPDHIKDLINGKEYTSTGGCSCTCNSDCDISYWQGLPKLVAYCVQLKWLEHYEYYKAEKVDKEIGSRKYYKRSLSSLKIKLHNEMAVLNNINTCGCVSLCQYIEDNDQLYPDYKGIWLKLITII